MVVKAKGGGRRCWRVGKIQVRGGAWCEQKNTTAHRSRRRKDLFGGGTDAAYVRVVLKWLVGGWKFGDERGDIFGN